MQNIKEKLLSDVMSSSWEPLKPHLERGAIFMVDFDLELVDVGLALVQDEADRVKTWMNKEMLSPPTNQERKDFDLSDEVMFNILIVEPYVLVQKKVEA